MDETRIAELLEPFLQGPNDQPPAANDVLYRDISTYIDVLLRWNAHINLTAIRDPEDIVTRHFGESLFAARRLFPDPTVGPATETAAEPSITAARQTAERAAAERRKNAAHGANRGSVPQTEQAPEGRKNITASSTPADDDQGGYQATASSHAEKADANDQRPFLACPERGEGTNDGPRVADLGSGAGFPGLPIKLWAPHIALTLIESNYKKATFLREVTRALTLTDVYILNIRAQGPMIAEFPMGPFDVVTLRAVERFEDTLPTAATLLAPSGRLALLIGTSQLDPARSKLPTFTWRPPVAVPNSRSRTLLIGQRNPQP